MGFKFNTATFEMIQNLAYPLISTLTGFDPITFVGDKSELFIKVGDAFSDISALFLVIGTALEDGKLTAEEIEEIILKAKDIPSAVDDIVAFFDNEDEVIEPEV